MKYFFTADTHFQHSNILVYCSRPFKDVEEMDNEIIRRWNERVKPEDTVFMIGDFIFKGGKQGGMNKALVYEKKLNAKIIYIHGNHDTNNNMNTIIESLQIRYGGRKINLVHQIEHVKRGMLNLVGHVHGAWRFKYYEVRKQIEPNKYELIDVDYTTPCVNVGVDVNNFYPMDIQEITQLVASEQRKLLTQVKVIGGENVKKV